MKRILLIICIIFSSSAILAQDIGIDGFKLGSTKMGAIGNVASSKDNLKYDAQGDNWLRYASGKSLSYELHFNNDKLSKIIKTSQTYNPDMFESFIEEEYINIASEYGNPTASGDSYALWRGDNYKVSLNYSVTSEQYQSLERDIFGPPTMKTIYTLTVTIKFELLNLNSTASRVSSATSQYVASGSGIVLTNNGVIATNYHVIENAKQIDVAINRNGEIKTYLAKVIVADKTNDLALIKIDDASFTPYKSIPYGVKTNISDVGTSVFAMGYPMSNYLGEEVKVTDGIINSKTGYKGDIVTYQISAPIQSGNSGGPLFDKQGYLIGITNAGIPDASVVGYAIKTSYLKNLIDVAPSEIPINTQSTISTLSFTEKVKALSEYVVYIKIK